MPAYVGNPLAGDPIWEASSAFELRIAITTKQVSRAGHPSDLLVAKSRSRALDEADAAEDKQHARATTVCFPSSIDDPLLTGSWPRLKTGIATSDQVRKLSG
jgi:hypothetical protein